MNKCSCGKCLGGVLSPRTAFRFSKTADSCQNLIMDSLDSSWPAKQDQPCHDPDLPFIDYLPVVLRLEVAKPFIIGYANCFATIAWAIKQSQLPKPRIVKQCSSIVAGLNRDASKHYFNNGGMAEFALDAVIATCLQEHEYYGDAAFLADSDNKSTIEKLPKCNNDDDFDLIQYSMFQDADCWPCGPYYNNIGYDDDDGYNAGGGGDGDGGGDGWVHYDTSSWVPPAEKKKGEGEGEELSLNGLSLEGK